MSEAIEDVPLHEAASQRYLNYALSVITARALPDIRDGLKPVQRRILYAMQHDLSLSPDAKHRKSAAVVGDVMGKYHPHGDQSIYDAMVRMAQDWVLRYPLVDGQGNFGSVDGDNPAAMRYTEAKLRHVAMELLSELKKRTVDYRQNYDGTRFEPVVLPAQLPNLLLNGASGIAVGMATNIPPHNLREVVGALIALIDEPELPLERIVGKYVKAPDFPTGGEILNSREELLSIYREGVGAVEMRGTWELEDEGRRHFVVISSIPYGVNKSALISDIADHIRGGKLPQLIDVRDESTDVMRVVLELKKGANAEAAMAYLCKRTALQSRFNVNFTALCPTEHPDLTRPRRLDLREALELFLEFRYDVTRRRLTFDLEQLEKRIHLLRAFEIIFDALDEAIRLIRESDGKADARERLMDRFALDWDQAEAVLETKLYRLAKMEIDAIRQELAEKEAQAAEIRTTLASEQRMWALIRSELEQIREAYGDRRRTKVVGPQEAPEFSEEVYIVAEDAYVIVTRDGWVKRQKSYTDLSAIRVREGDEIGWVMPASSKEALVLFTDTGRAYTLRIADIGMTTGYGEPIQTRFDFADGERIVGVVASDARVLPLVPDEQLDGLTPDDPIPPYFVALSRGGKALRMSLDAFREPSTVKGRTFMRLDAKVPDDAVIGVVMSNGTELVSLASRQGRCLVFPVHEINVLGGAGKGVMAIKLGREDLVMGFRLVTDRMDGLTVETNRGRAETIRSNKFSVGTRGNRGREIIRVGYIARIETEPLELAFRREGASMDADAVEPSDEVTDGPNDPDDDGQVDLL